VAEVRGLFIGKTLGTNSVRGPATAFCGTSIENLQKYIMCTSDISKEGLNNEFLLPNRGARKTAEWGNTRRKDRLNDGWLELCGEWGFRWKNRTLSVKLKRALASASLLLYASKRGSLPLPAKGAQLIVIAQMPRHFPKNSRASDHPCKEQISSSWIH